MGTYHAVRSLHFSSQTPTLHLDSYRHSTSRCNTVVTINMYTKAIALAILAVAGVQAQSDSTTRTATRHQPWPAPPTCRRPRAPLPRATCPCRATALGRTPRAQWPAAEWVAAARRRPTRPSTRVPPAHRRPPEMSLDSAWRLLACCKPVKSLGWDRSASQLS